MSGLEEPSVRPKLTSSLSGSGIASGVSPEAFCAAEREYVDNLGKALDMVRALRHPLSPDETKTISGTQWDESSVAEFSGVLEFLIDPLVTASEALLDTLLIDYDSSIDTSAHKLRKEAWPSAFLNLGPVRNLAVYRLYCDKFEWLQDFLRAKSGASPSKLGLLLDVPLRRIQDYYRVLRNLENVFLSPESSTLWKETDKVLKKVHIQASQELIREGSRREILELGALFDKQIPIYNPHRALLRKEAVRIKSDNDAMGAVLAVLLSDALLVCKLVDTNLNSLPAGAQRLALLYVITLRRCETPELSENKKDIRIESSKPGTNMREKNTFIISFENVSSAAVWHFQLQNAIQGSKVEAELETKDWQGMNAMMKSLFGGDRSMSKFVDAEALLNSTRRGSKEQDPNRHRSSSAHMGMLAPRARRRSNRGSVRFRMHTDSNGAESCPLCLRKRNVKETPNVCSECGKDVCQSCFILQENGNRVCEECNIVLTL